MFFLVVGLEIKRELVHGELRSPRTVALPVLAVLEGMVVPGADLPGCQRWWSGVRRPPWPPTFLRRWRDGSARPTGSGLAQAVPAHAGLADGLGAIVVIALFCASETNTTALGLAVGLVVAIEVLRRARVTWMPCFVVLGRGRGGDLASGSKPPSPASPSAS